MITRSSPLHKYLKRYLIPPMRVTRVQRSNSDRRIKMQSVLRNDAVVVYYDGMFSSTDTEISLKEDATF